MRGVRERNQKLVAALTFPPAPPSAPPRGEKGGMSEAGAISRTRSPLSRSAGEGPGVRASRSAGEGPGVRASRSAGEGLGVRASRSAGEEGGIIPPDLPPSPPSAHPQGEKGGMSEAGAISRTRSPLSRSAGEGLGVRASRSAGEGPGVRGYGVSEAHLTRHAQRLALPARQRERAADGGTERWPSNAVVARARYIPNKQSGFLIIL